MSSTAPAQDPAALRVLRRLVRGLEVVEYAVAGAVLVLLIAATFLGVVLRYAFDSPFTWLEEAQLASMVWIAFLAAPIAFRHGGHVAIELVVDALPRRARRAAEVVVALVVLATLAYFFVQCLTYLETFVRTGRATPILKIPYTVVYGIAPVSLVLMAVSYLSAELPALLGRPRPSQVEVVA